MRIKGAPRGGDSRQERERRQKLYAKRGLLGGKICNNTRSGGEVRRKERGEEEKRGGEEHKGQKD